MSRPFRVATPRPCAWAASKAAMTARASSTWAVARGEDLVGRLDLPRVDQRLAVEAHLAALARLGEEAVGVLDVVVDAVDDGHAGSAGREDGQLQRGLDRGPRPGTCWRRAPWRGRWCPDEAGEPVGRRGDLLGVQHRHRRLDHGPQPRVRGRPGGLHRRDERAHLVGRVHLRHDDRVRAGRRCGSEVGVVPLRAETVDADRQLASAVLAGSRLRRRRSRAPASLASGATASSRSRMSASTGSVLAFSRARSLDAGM